MSTSSPIPSPSVLAAYDQLCGTANEFLARHTPDSAGKYDDAAIKDLYRTGINFGLDLDAERLGILAQVQGYAVVKAVEVIHAGGSPPNSDLPALPSELVVQQLAQIAQVTGHIMLGS